MQQLQLKLVRCCCAPAGNDTCSSDANCAAGKVCVKSSPVLKCACRDTDGTDSCESVGTCVDFCASKADYIASVNELVPSCDSIFDTSCGQGRPHVFV